MNLQASHSLVLRLEPLTVRCTVAALFLFNFFLLFFPWHRVLVPSMLVAGKPPPAPLKDVVLIVGCPASLNERAPAGDLKVDAVKKAAVEFIDKLPESMRLALILYGHKRGGECHAEIVHKLGVLNTEVRNELKKLIAEVNPVGLSPVADGLKLAGEELARNQAGGGIVLIADGADTCDGDPLAQVASLSKRLEMNHGVNVLGFSVIPKDIRTLRNIAQGKGKFFDAQTISELDEAVATILKETRTTVESDFIASSLVNTNQSGLSMAFGADPVPAAFLSLVYFCLVVLGAAAGIGLLALHLAPPLKSLEIRFSPVLRLGMIALSAGALLVLALQLFIGFPIESEFRRHAFTYRSSWLTLVFLTNALALLSTLMLFWLERKPDGTIPQARIEW